MAKFQFNDIVNTPEIVTCRLGDGTRTSGETISDADVGKLVKLGGDSRYALTASGDEFEGRISSVEVASQDDYIMGAVQKEGRYVVTLEATTIATVSVVPAVGDFVVAGTQTTKGTKLGTTYPKVIKAAAATTFKWRVVALFGNGTAGTNALVEFIY